MKTIEFNKDGGPLIAEVTAGFAQQGTYVLRLLEKDLSRKMLVSGDFKNNDDDTYTLPSPASSNDGRILHCMIILTIFDPPKYHVSLKVFQDGLELDSVDDPEVGSGETDQERLLQNPIE